METPLNFRPHYISDLLTIFIVCCIVYIAPSSFRPLSNPDEGRYSEIPREMVQSGDWVTPRLNGVPYFYKPPMFYWMQAASIESFGINRTSLRLPNSLVAIFGIMLTYAAGRAIYGRTAGIFAAAFLGTTILYYAMASIIILDMAVAVFITGSLLAFILAWRQKDNGKKRFFFWICAFVFSALAVMTKGLIGVIIPGMVAFIYLGVMNPLDSIKKISKADIFAWGVGLLVFAAITVPWHVMAAIANPPFETAEGLLSRNPQGQGFFWYYIINEHFWRYLHEETSHRFAPFWFFFLIVPVGFIPWIVILPRAIRETVRGGWNKLKQNNPEFIFFSVWVLFTIFFFSISKSKLIPYIVPVYPALALILAPFIAKLWSNAGKISLKIEAYILCALGIIGAIALVPVFKIFEKKGQILDPEVAIWAFSGTIIFLLIGSVCTLIFVMKGHKKKGLLATFITIGLFLLMFNPFARHVQRADTEGFAEIIKSERASGEKIIAAYCYGDAQDLPVWMNETIFVYGVYGDDNPHGLPEEQRFGFEREKDLHKDRYLTHEAFKNLIAKENVYIVVRNNALEKITSAAETLAPMRELAKKGRLILLTNKPEKHESN